MGTILPFRTSGRDRRRAAKGTAARPCEIVIFPGVRIERHGFDLGYRLRDSAGRGEFDGLGPRGETRKTS
jgi:hypothetical protein